MAALTRRARRLLEKHASPRDLPADASRRLLAWADGEDVGTGLTLRQGDVPSDYRPTKIRATALRFVKGGATVFAVGMVLTIWLSGAGDWLTPAVSGTLSSIAIGAVILGCSAVLIAVFVGVMFGALGALMGFTYRLTPFYVWYDEAYLCTWSVGSNPVLQCFEWKTVESVQGNVTPGSGGSAFPELEIRIETRNGRTHRTRWVLLCTLTKALGWKRALETAAELRTQSMDVRHDGGARLWHAP